jgi:predicted nucleic acid-binding protein
VKRIVLDANILIRGVLGSQVYSLLEQYHHSTQFLTTETAFEEIERHLPQILAKRHPDPELQQLVLANIGFLHRLVTAIPLSIITPFEVEARTRLHNRDVDDWHILALEMGLNCPIWTEDNDFFGVGVTTWRTANIRYFFEPMFRLC